MYIRPASSRVLQYHLGYRLVQAAPHGIHVYARRHFVTWAISTTHAIRLIEQMLAIKRAKKKGKVHGST